MPKKIDASLRERAVRMLRYHRQDYLSDTALAEAVATKFGVGRETVRRWLVQDDVENWRVRALDDVATAVLDGTVRAGEQAELPLHHYTSSRPPRPTRRRGRGRGQGPHRRPPLVAKAGKPAVLEVRLVTKEHWSLTDLDLSLARQISAAARALGVSAADPDHTRTWEFALDALDVDKVRTFWCAVLGYEMVGDTDIADPDGLYPAVYVQQMDEMRTGRNRIHIDLGVPHNQAEARVAAALAGGGTLVSDRFRPMWWTLADPEGNEVDLATWIGRD